MMPSKRLPLDPRTMRCKPCIILTITLHLVQKAIDFIPCTGLKA